MLHLRAFLDASMIDMWPLIAIGQLDNIHLVYSYILKYIYICIYIHYIFIYTKYIYIYIYPLWAGVAVSIQGLCQSCLLGQWAWAEGSSFRILGPVLKGTIQF